MINRFTEFDEEKTGLAPIAGYWAYPLVSLEQALEPFLLQINELDRSIKEAYKRCHFPSEHGLTRDEASAVHLYTMEAGSHSFYRILNKVLRNEDRSKIKPWFHYLKLFDTALRKLPTVKACIWRGVSRNVTDCHHENDRLTWWSINSCSTSVKVVENFLKSDKDCTLFMIEATNGKNISQYTYFPEEKEVILGIGTNLCVKSNALQHGKLRVIHLVEVDNSSHDPVPMAMAPISATPKLYAPPRDTRWEQAGVTITGGHEYGQTPNEVYYPFGLYVDENQTVVIADWLNQRIVEWKYGAISGQVVAGENERGNQMDQFDNPTDVITDKQTNSLIICDQGNKRVMRWSRENGTAKGEMIIDNIDCFGLTMDKERNVYVTDQSKHEVRCYRMGENKGTVVAGGNGKGDRLNQLNEPHYVFVDGNYSVYVSDYQNHRVMKWIKGATEGIIVAGGRGKGSGLSQLWSPQGVIVDALDTVYVVDSWNQRVMRWNKGVKTGEIIVGGNGEGQQANQLNYPVGLSFDRYGNLYIADYRNHRVQRFSIKTSL